MFSKDETLKMLTNCEIPVINPSTNYWFIRTNGGDNFENFILVNMLLSVGIKLMILIP